MTKDEALKLALEALEKPSWSHAAAFANIKEAITVLRQAIAEAEQAQPVACIACDQAHAVLDADESKIIRDAKDGYPEGRKPRVLTLAERVSALCTYAADWKRWCLEKEAASPPRQPLTDEQIINEADRFDWSKDCAVRFARAIEAKLKENT
jgi:hypothetical protein